MMYIARVLPTSEEHDFVVVGVGPESGNNVHAVVTVDPSRTNGHSVQIIAIVAALAAGVFLGFNQEAPDPENPLVASLITDGLPCPVVVTFPGRASTIAIRPAGYGDDLSELRPAIYLLRTALQAPPPSRVVEWRSTGLNWTAGTGEA